MQNDVYKDDVLYVVVTEDGKVVTDDSRGFDEATIRTIRDFLHPPEKPLPLSEKPQMEQWQKWGQRWSVTGNRKRKGIRQMMGFQFVWYPFALCGMLIFKRAICV